MSRKKPDPSSRRKVAATNRAPRVNRKRAGESPAGPKRSGENQAANKSAASQPSTLPAVAARQRNLTSDDIGHVAGEIWALLSEMDAQTVAALKNAIDAPADVVVAAVGWLAREDKVTFAAAGRSVKVSLK